MARKNVDTTETTLEATPETAVETTETVLEATSEVVEERTVTETALERTAEPDTSLAEAIREGASDAREAAANFFPSVGKVLRRGVYNGFYLVTYGVVFGALTVGRLIPSNNAMGEGVRDGFKAASQAFDAREKAREAVEDVTLDEGLAPAAA